MFGTGEHSEGSTSDLFVWQIHTKFLLPNPLPAKWTLKPLRAVLFSKPAQQVSTDMQSSVDEHMEGRFKSFVKFKLCYIFFIPLIYQACHSVLEGN